ncbi:hypothetical protein F4859DRAFT_196916 [Xylaria cf. heliscus]|nr:hypothetical protein F4859DRAFT_196916 [Xylaria cf. heliscus]
MPAFQLHVLISIAKQLAIISKWITLSRIRKEKKVWDFNRSLYLYTPFLFYVLSQRGVSGILKVSNEDMETVESRHILIFLFVFNLGHGPGQSIFLYGARQRHWIFSQQDWNGFYRCLICRPLATTKKAQLERRTLSLASMIPHKFSHYGKGLRRNHIDT